jgi:hypothetical protein
MARIQLEVFEFTICYFAPFAYSCMQSRQRVDLVGNQQSQERARRTVTE